MSEKDETPLNITKALVAVPLVMLAAWGSASSNGLETLLAAAPAATLIASSTIGTLLAERKTKKEETLTFPQPHWWTSDRASWQGLCAEIVTNLSGTVDAINKRLLREQQTPTELAIRQAFIEEVVADRRITWEHDPATRRRAADVVATPLLQKVADVVKDVIGPTREDAVLVDTHSAAINTEKLVAMLKEATEKLDRIDAAIQQEKLQSSSASSQQTTPSIQVTPLSATSSAQGKSVDDILLQKIKNDEYDVFISYNSMDEDEVKKVAEQLKEFAILPWLEEEDTEPAGAEEREDQIAKQIAKINVAAIFVGKNGVARWQQMITNAFLRQFVKREAGVMPVLLASMLAGEPPLPLFLEGMAWVDFRKSNPNPMERLLWGITKNRFYYREWIRNA